MRDVQGQPEVKVIKRRYIRLPGTACVQLWNWGGRLEKRKTLHTELQAKAGRAGFHLSLGQHNA